MGIERLSGLVVTLLLNNDSRARNLDLTTTLSAG